MPQIPHLPRAPHSPQSGSLPLTALSPNSWQQKYPHVGQFAVTAEEEVIAAGPSGLFYFKRIRDHESKPWSEAKPLDLDEIWDMDGSSVTGLAVQSTRSRLDVYYVSEGRLFGFHRTGEVGRMFSMTRDPPLSTYSVSGTPAIVTIIDEYDNPWRWSLIVPCQSGGLLHTPIGGARAAGVYSPAAERELVNHVAKGLGVVSAVSAAAIYTKRKSSEERIDIVAPPVWDAGLPTRIQHPGEVTGNPVLLTKDRGNSLDLLVSSADRGIFHFIRTSSAPDEWHMTARIAFPPGIPAASCLTLNTTNDERSGRRQFTAIIQSGGRLYQSRTHDRADPWAEACLKPIIAPGPFFDKLAPLPEDLKLNSTQLCG
ncbi:hypothetical protein F4802DRAFT_613789 [Xylaria palmicola]|nr:hypothetical protein F4802DRAFT_613789 [Xylaria palmicola]